MKKQCTVCYETKPIQDFAWKSKTKGTRQACCDPCRRNRQKESYGKHKKAVIAKTVARNSAHSERFQAYKATLKCLLCSESEPCTLDFHHPNPHVKDFTISEFVRKRGWKSLMEEVHKCLPLCASCHRKVHAGILRCPVSSVD